MGLVDRGALAHTQPLGRALRLPFHILQGLPSVKVLRGPLRGLRWIPRSGIARIWLGFYEPLVTKTMMDLVKPGDTVYDVGANVGAHTLLAARLVEDGTVVAFEPLPENVLFLKEHLALNELRNTVVVEAAVTDAVGQANFSVAPNRSMGHLGNGSLRVETISLDAYGGSPSVVKIDVEGDELNVLQGARRILTGVRPYLIVAIHDDNGEKCEAFLHDLGYLVSPLDGETWLASPTHKRS